MLKTSFIHLLVLFLVSLSTANSSEHSSNSETEFFELIAQIKNVYLPGQLPNINQLCITSMTKDEHTIILVEDYYSCTYALRFRNQIGKTINLQEPSEVVSNGHPDDLDTIELQILFPTAKLVFLEPL